MTKSVFLEPYSVFTRELVAARLAAALTQSELAGRLKKPQSFISKYERGERRLDLVEFLAVCRALEVDAAKIMQTVDRSIPTGIAV